MLTLDGICDIAKGSDIIGISFMTYYFDRAVQVADYLKKSLDNPILFGGVHPTVSPEECLEHCDGVCVGEGEIPLSSLAENKGEFGNTPNLVFQGEEGIIHNEIAPFIQDLDSLPFFDFSLESHFVLNHKTYRVEPLGVDGFRRLLPLLPGSSGNFNPVYRTMSTRGCPHECYYCVNKFFKSLYPGQKYLRRRSPENVVKELEHIKERFDFIGGVQFFDDTFFAASTDYIEKFSALYRDRIGLPLYCQCSPSTITERKLRLLLSAGLIMLEMGIQTGSEKEAETFHRTESRKRLEESIDIIQKNSSLMVRPHYHLILDSPWLETEDLKATLSLLLKIPTPYKLCLASLTFFPGTELHQRALEEGLIKDRFKQIYRKPFYKFKGNYLNWLILLCGIEFIPRRLIRFLSNDFFVKIFHRPQSSLFFSILIALSEKIRLVSLGLKSLFSWDFRKLSFHLREIK